MEPVEHRPTTHDVKHRWKDVYRQLRLQRAAGVTVAPETVVLRSVRSELERPKGIMHRLLLAIATGWTLVLALPRSWFRRRG
jgi:hypothetical protein